VRGWREREQESVVKLLLVGALEHQGIVRVCGLVAVRAVGGERDGAES
jgi:hypothetical protein